MIKYSNSKLYKSNRKLSFHEHEFINNIHISTLNIVEKH